MSEKTIFEKIIDREVPSRVVYEDEYTIAFLDIAPFDKGHTIVVAKKKFETIWDMDQETYMALQATVHKIAAHVHDTLGVGVAVYQRNLASAGQEVPYVHVHVLPRNDDEGDRPVFNDLMENRISYKSDEEADKFLELLKLS